MEIKMESSLPFYVTLAFIYMLFSYLSEYLCLNCSIKFSILQILIILDSYSRISFMYW